MGLLCIDPRVVPEPIERGAVVVHDNYHLAVKSGNAAGQRLAKVGYPVMAVEVINLATGKCGSNSNPPV